MRLGNWGYGQYGSTNYYPRWIAVKGYESTGAIMVDGWMVRKSEIGAYQSKILKAIRSRHQDW